MICSYVLPYAFCQLRIIRCVVPMCFSYVLFFLFCLSCGLSFPHEIALPSCPCFSRAPRGLPASGVDTAPSQKTKEAEVTVWKIYGHYGIYQVFYGHVRTRNLAPLYPLLLRRLSQGLVPYPPPPEYQPPYPYTSMPGDYHNILYSSGLVSGIGNCRYRHPGVILVCIIQIPMYPWNW